MKLELKGSRSTGSHFDNVAKIGQHDVINFTAPSTLYTVNSLIEDCLVFNF